MWSHDHHYINMIGYFKLIRLSSSNCLMSSHQFIQHPIMYVDIICYCWTSKKWFIHTRLVLNFAKAHLWESSWTTSQRNIVHVRIYCKQHKLAGLEFCECANKSVWWFHTELQVFMDIRLNFAIGKIKFGKNNTIHQIYLTLVTPIFVIYSIRRFCKSGHIYWQWPLLTHTLVRGYYTYCCNSFMDCWCSCSGICCDIMSLASDSLFCKCFCFFSISASASIKLSLSWCARCNLRFIFDTRIVHDH